MQRIDELLQSGGIAREDSKSQSTSSLPTSADAAYTLLIERVDLLLCVQ